LVWILMQFILLMSTLVYSITLEV